MTKDEYVQEIEFTRDYNIDFLEDKIRIVIKEILKNKKTTDNEKLKRITNTISFYEKKINHIEIKAKRKLNKYFASKK